MVQHVAIDECKHSRRLVLSKKIKKRWNFYKNFNKRERKCIKTSTFQQFLCKKAQNLSKSRHLDAHSSLQTPAPPLLSPTPSEPPKTSENHEISAFLPSGKMTGNIMVFRVFSGFFGVFRQRESLGFFDPYYSHLLRGVSLRSGVAHGGVKNVQKKHIFRQKTPMFGGFFRQLGYVAHRFARFVAPTPLRQPLYRQFFCHCAHFLSINCQKIAQFSVDCSRNLDFFL